MHIRTCDYAVLGLGGLKAPSAKQILLSWQRFCDFQILNARFIKIIFFCFFIYQSSSLSFLLRIQNNFAVFNCFISPFIQLTDEINPSDLTDSGSSEYESDCTQGVGGQVFLCPCGQGVGGAPNVHESPRQVGRWSKQVKIWSTQFVNDPQRPQSTYIDVGSDSLIWGAFT